MPPDPGNLLTIERTVLADLLEHAAAAALIAGHLDAPAIEPLGNHVDAIVHGLTELLGDPHTLAAPDAAAPDDRKARDGAPMLTSIAGGAP